MGIGKDDESMNTLVIYDSAGKIYYQVTGNVQEPAGIPFLWVDIPEGKRLVSINTSVNPHEPVFEDMPSDATKELREQFEALKTELKNKTEESLQLILTVLEAMAETYEKVLPFLP